MSEMSTLDRALLNPRVYRDNKQIDTLKEIKDGTATNIRTYARYWHGYITYLRPLLFIYDYNLIRLVLFAVHLSLSVAFIVLVNKKLGTLPTIAFVSAYVLSGSFVTPFSLQYFNVMTVTQVSGIVLLKSYNFLHKKGWITYFFLLTGIVTVYFDLLTFPVVSLGVNLVLLLLLDGKIGIKQILLMTFMWCVGYAGMWILKWTIATIFTNENVFVSAMQNADKRSGSAVEGVGITYLDVLKRNVGRYRSKALLVPYIIIFLLSFVPIVKNRSLKINKKRTLCLVFICALPFMWYALLRNHSYVHSWFTFRTLIPAIIAFMLLRECFDTLKT